MIKLEKKVFYFLRWGDLDVGFVSIVGGLFGVRVVDCVWELREDGSSGIFFEFRVWECGLIEIVIVRDFKIMMFIVDFIYN